VRRVGGQQPRNAAYEMGRVCVMPCTDLGRRLAAWAPTARASPNGCCGLKADLSILETLAKLGDKAAALTEAEAFLARYPNGERRDEGWPG